MHTTRALLLVGAAVLTPAIGLVAAQESPQVTRLSQELDTLRYRLDFENRQLRQQIDRLESRVADLEREAGMPVPVRPVMPVLPAPDVGAGELTARRFVVEDAEGRIRAVLGFSDIYGPMLALLDGDGGLRMVLTQDDPETAGLRILDAQGVVRARLALDGGEAALRLYDAEGRELPPSAPYPGR